MDNRNIWVWAGMVMAGIVAAAFIWPHAAKWIVVGIMVLNLVLKTTK